MDATKMKAPPEETEDAMERQELFEEEINFDTIGSSQDRCEDRRLVVQRHREAKKRTQDSVGVPAEVVCRPQASDTSRRPCSAQGPNV
jgi:hypothetical protein